MWIVDWKRQQETSLGSTYTERLTIKNILAGTDDLIEKSESLTDKSFFNAAFSILDGRNESGDEYQNLYVKADVSIGECKTLLRKLKKYNEYYVQYYGTKRIKRIESNLESAKENYLSIYREAKQKYEKCLATAQTTTVQASTTIPTDVGNVQRNLNGSIAILGVFLPVVLLFVVLIIKLVRGKHTLTLFVKLKEVLVVLKQGFERFITFSKKIDDQKSLLLVRFALLLSLFLPIYAVNPPLNLAFGFLASVSCLVSIVYLPKIFCCFTFFVWMYGYLVVLNSYQYWFSAVYYFCFIICCLISILHFTFEMEKTLKLGFKSFTIALILLVISIPVTVICRRDVPFGMSNAVYDKGVEIFELVEQVTNETEWRAIKDTFSDNEKQLKKMSKSESEISLYNLIHQRSYSLNIFCTEEKLIDLKKELAGYLNRKYSTVSQSDDQQAPAQTIAKGDKFHLMTMELSFFILFALIAFVLIIGLIRGKRTPVMQSDIVSYDNPPTKKISKKTEKPVPIKTTNRKKVVHNFYEYAMNYPKGEYKTSEEYQADEPKLKANKITALRFGIVTSAPVILLNVIAGLLAPDNNTFVIVVVWLFVIAFWMFVKHSFEPFQYKTLSMGYFIGVSIILAFMFLLIAAVNIYPKAIYMSKVSGYYFFWCGMVCLGKRTRFKDYVEIVQQDLMRIYEQTHLGFACPGLPIAELVRYRTKKTALYVMADTEFENDYQWLKARRDTIKEIKKGLLQPEINFTSVEQADIGDKDPRYAILVEE